MTTYLAAITYGQNGSAFINKFALRPITDSIKIVRVEYLAANSADVTRFASSTTTGGTALTPVPMRDGSAASTVLARVNPTAISGTPSYFVPNGQAGSPFTPVLDLVVAPGSVFALVGGSLSYVSIYYEEIRDDLSR